MLNGIEQDLRRAHFGIRTEILGAIINTGSSKKNSGEIFIPVSYTHLDVYKRQAFGFQSVAYAGPETGVRDRASYVLQQGKIRLVLTSGLRSDSPICQHQLKHGDGVKVLALWVDDCLLYTSRCV